jgi:hypothetical protein
MRGSSLIAFDSQSQPTAVKGAAVRRVLAAFRPVRSHHSGGVQCPGLSRQRAAGERGSRRDRDSCEHKYAPPRPPSLTRANVRV